MDNYIYFCFYIKNDMVNLKVDLIYKIGNDKYYAELELSRLANDNSISYETKIHNIIIQLSKITEYNSNIDLVNLYFCESFEDNNKLEEITKE